MLKWEKKTVNRMVSKDVVMVDGVPAVHPVSGKPVTKSRTVPETLEYPVIDPQDIKSNDDFFIALENILAEAKPGYDSLLALVELWNFGAERGAADLIRRGNDLQYTVSQRDFMRNIANSVRDGWLKVQQGADILTGAGIPNALQGLERMLAAGHSDSDSEE